MKRESLTIGELRRGYTAKDYSAAEVTQAYLDEIGTRDKRLGAFLRVREAAIDDAKAADKRLQSGQDPRPLEGVPIAVKDNMLMSGDGATAGSKILEHYRAMYTATAVQRLLDAGAIVIGKTNLDEFAMGTSTENSALAVTRNPWNTDYVPGGSSGGSAVAVAARLAPVAIGSDTGGSIRQPAAFCGVVGMKPTYGRISRYGLIALASSLDQIGPFAQTAEDAARLLQVMAGPDACDATSSQTDVDDYFSTLNESIAGLRIGVPKEFFDEGLDPDIRKSIDDAIAEYTKLGVIITEVSLPHALNALAAYYIIQPAEASSNLARYDGIRYGLSVRNGKSLEEVYRHTRAQGFGAEVKRRIMVGTFSLSAGYADAYYHQANHIRQVIREEFHQIFDSIDVLLTPTTPTPPFKLGDKTQDPLSMYLADLYTVPANLAGNPAISIPVGMTRGLPIGMQLMARSWDEATLLRVAHAFQQVTDWHTQTPPSA